MFSVAGLVLGEVLARNARIEDQASLNKIRIMSGMMGGTPAGLLVTKVIVDQETPGVASVPPQIPDGNVNARVEVPNVVGQPAEQAEATLSSFGLQVQREDVRSTSAKGLIISQDPSAGRIVEQSSFVQLTASQGDLLVPVPDVRGEKFEDAQKKLRSQNFTVERRDLSADDAQVGLVILQIPEANERAVFGSQVVLVVGKKRIDEGDKIKLLDFVGKRFEEAREWLQDKGLRVEHDYRDIKDRNQHGLVLEQDPKAGSEVARESSVRLTVGNLKGQGEQGK